MTFLPAFAPVKPRLVSRHPTHKAIAPKLAELPFHCLIRFGTQGRIPGRYVELNTVEACANASNKLLMKQCFTRHGVKTAPWSQDPYAFTTPIVAKHIMGSRGTGVYLLRSKYELDAFVRNRRKDLNLFIFEQFMPHNREYRCHTWEGGIFYSCRKALKNNTPRDEQWKFNHEQTVWLREENPNFNRPECWPAIEQECIKAMRACGLQFTGADVKVSADGKDFFIIEINSAPSFGDLTTENYLHMLPKIAHHTHKTKGHTWHFLP